MTFDPGKPVFMGKRRFETTNASGQKYYLSYTTVGAQTAPTLSATTADSTTLWISYDAGGGAVVLVAANGLYLAVLEGLQQAVLVPEAAGAAAITLVPQTQPGQVQWTWVDPASAATLEMYLYYDLGTGLPATLSFLPPPQGGSLLSTLTQTMPTPGLATIKASRSAAGLDLTGVNLTGVDLSGVDCTRAHFDRAILAGTKLAGATLTNAVFARVDLTGVVWGNDISAVSADFTDTIGVGIVVPSSGTGGKRATFDSATFTGADWSGCDLTNASLHNAFVTGANFAGATLTGAYLYVLQAGKSNDGLTPGADFSYAYMPDVNLQAANLNGANLSHAQLYYLNTGASLLNANLTETDFSGTDLTGATFGGIASAIAGTNFDNAILFDCSFNGVTLELSANGLPVTMVGARLENATFTNTAFANVQMGGARIAVNAHVVTGVPLFTIAVNVPGYIAALDRAALPGDFAGPTGLFATWGCILARAATVAVVTPGQLWIVSQPPTLMTPGLEDVGFSVVATSGLLKVYASNLWLVEQGDGGSAYGTPYTVAATALLPTDLSADTRCPNRCTKATNDARMLTWEAMVTAPRLALAGVASALFESPSMRSHGDAYESF